MTTRPEQAWVYRAQLVRIVDGDTLELRLDLGLRTYRVERVRLFGVTVSERGTTAGKLATAFVYGWCKQLERGGGSVLDWPLTIQTARAGDRYWAVVWDARDGRCLNDDLLATGMGWAA